MKKRRKKFQNRRFSKKSLAFVNLEVLYTMKYFGEYLDKIASSLNRIIKPMLKMMQKKVDPMFWTQLVDSKPRSNSC